MTTYNEGSWVGKGVNIVFSKNGKKIKLVKHGTVLQTLQTKDLVIKAGVASFASSDDVVLMFNRRKKSKKKTVEFIQEKSEEIQSHAECLRCGESVALDDVDSLGVCSYCSKVGDE